MNRWLAVVTPWMSLVSHGRAIGADVAAALARHYPDDQPTGQQLDAPGFVPDAMA